MKPITIKAIHLHCVSLPFVEPLKTSYGAEPFKSAILVEVVTDTGVIGWGESALKTKPSYGAETMAIASHIMQEFLVPKLVGQTIQQPTDVPAMFKSVRGNHHAKAGVEFAVWDAFAKANDMRLADCFVAFLPNEHNPRSHAIVGVSIGIQPSIEDTIAIIQKRLDQGYGRIKLKIAPNWDVELARAVREHFPNISLMLDANSAYTLADADYLKQLDDLHLLMIEQPLGYDDIYEHSQLQPQLNTPICLDESIYSAHDLQLMLTLNAGKILNLKPVRVGGFTESLKIYARCAEQKVPLWIGGMLETGIGRAANVAFASLPAVTLPSDISATDRYFNPDVTEPPFVLEQGSRLTVPDGLGIGVEVIQERVEEAKNRWQANNPFA